MPAEASHSPIPPDPLDRMRIEIDDYDQQILELVKLRTLRSLGIAVEKAARDIKTLVPGRENEVIGNYLAAADASHGLLARQDAVRLGGLVMEISRTAQDNWRAEQAVADATQHAELEGLAAQAAQDQQGDAR
jgi:chorismate mutase